jgi:hypothetical protein
MFIKSVRALLFVIFAFISIDYANAHQEEISAVGEDGRVHAESNQEDLDGNSDESRTLLLDAPLVGAMAPYKCGDYLESGTSGTTEFLKSDMNALCTLVEVTSSGFLKPVARSYDAFDWEAAPGAFSSLLAFQCSAESCSVELPALASGSIYQLTYFPKPSYSRSDESARFLEQATFGPTRSDIKSVNNTDNLGLSFAKWIKEQQTVIPLTSHRELFRQRLNAPYYLSTPMSPVTHACQKTTRYRRYALCNKDNSKIVIKTVGAYKVISVNNVTRTVLDRPVTYYDDGLKVYAEVPDGG